VLNIRGAGTASDPSGIRQYLHRQVPHNAQRSPV
jgi:hypothetical protein